MSSKQRVSFQIVNPTVPIKAGDVTFSPTVQIQCIETMAWKLKWCNDGIETDRHLSEVMVCALFPDLDG